MAALAEERTSTTCWLCDRTGSSAALSTFDRQNQRTVPATASASSILHRPPLLRSTERQCKREPSESHHRGAGRYRHQLGACASQQIEEPAEQRVAAAEDDAVDQVLCFVFLF